MKITKKDLNKPDFIIIGAMKCATSTLHDQLAMQPDFFMSTPKEPNYFSDDDIYAKGKDWYSSLFSKAKAGELKGESSTHYTKLPTYPKTIERIVAYVPQVKLIYVMRHPVDRLVSHYIHEWTQGVISCDINKAVYKFPQLLEYGCYGMQLEPYFESFDTSCVLPLFAERLRQNPLGELQSVFSFLNVHTTPVWYEKTISNVSAERMKKCEWRDAIVDNPVVCVMRRTFIPKTIRQKIRNLWTMKKRPVLSSECLQYVEKIFDKDLEQLGHKLGLELNCRNFKNVVTLQNKIAWVNK